MKKILENLLNLTTTSRSRRYEKYKEYCRVKKAILSADPGLVDSEDRFNHIVAQRELLFSKIR